MKFYKKIPHGKRCENAVKSMVRKDISRYNNFYKISVFLQNCKFPRRKCKPNLRHYISFYLIMHIVTAKNPTTNRGTDNSRKISLAYRHRKGMVMKMALLDVKNIRKTYTTRFGGNRVEALRNVSFSLEQGEYLAIMGESGSGKTTLLNVLASIDKPTDGSIRLNDRELSKIKDRELAKFRREHLGFVFQEFNLLDSFSLGDNICLPLVLAGEKYQTIAPKLHRVAKQVHIDGLLNKYPYEVSGGQKQRAAVCRAIITQPELILADEPTGALDSKSSDDLLNAFERIHEDGQSIIMVTHSTAAAARAGRVLFIKDGEIYHQIYRGSMTNEEMYKKISDTLTLLLSQNEQ